jgi:hypothetical protein
MSGPADRAASCCWRASTGSIVESTAVASRSKGCITTAEGVIIIGRKEDGFTRDLLAACSRAGTPHFFINETTGPRRGLTWRSDMDGLRVRCTDGSRFVGRAIINRSMGPLAALSRDKRDLYRVFEWHAFVQTISQQFAGPVLNRLSPQLWQRGVLESVHLHALSPELRPYLRPIRLTTRYEALAEEGHSNLVLTLATGHERYCLSDAAQRRAAEALGQYMPLLLQTGAAADTHLATIVGDEIIWRSQETGKPPSDEIAAATKSAAEALARLGAFTFQVCWAQAGVPRLEFVNLFPKLTGHVSDRAAVHAMLAWVMR